MKTKVLVIGLGGIGSEIVCRLEKQASPEQRENVRFVIMDTDVNTIAKLTRGGFGGHVVTMSDRLTVKEYLKENEQAGRWFMENEILSWKPVSEGAGQVRAVSRLAFELALRQQKLQPLYDAIHQLHITTADRSDGESMALRIVVVSTLAGGTGSGIMLPLAIHLRRYMWDVCHRRDVIIRGVFLLADCMDMVVSNETERKSLRGNTYAAVKELDAFMKKADGYLGERYKDIRIEEMGASSRENVMSYNYCYLFGARNEKSNELYSFQELKDYVVKCIHAQILGPMQELHNSIEDNVLKSTMTSGESGEDSEFNRYCAAGISILEYPYEKIVDYLAAEKMLDILGEQWMEIDSAYEESRKKQRQREKEGFYVTKLGRSEFYCSYVAEAAESSQMIRQIGRDTETADGRKKWDAYLDALKGDIRAYAAQQRSGLEWTEKRDTCENKLKALQDDRIWDGKSSIQDIASVFDDYYQLWGTSRESFGNGLEARYFNADSGREPKEWQFLYWLRDGEGMIHLNSVRYFLYQVLEKFEEQRRDAHEKKDRLEKQLRGLEDIGRTVEAAVRGILPWVTRAKRKMIRDGYEALLRAMDGCHLASLEERVYGEGLERLGQVSHAIEEFYKEYPRNRLWLLDEKERLYSNMTEQKSRALTYVGTDEKRMQQVKEQVEDYGRDLETNRQLSKKLFRILWDASKEDQETRRERVRELFRGDCLAFWTENLKKEYAGELDRNIIQVILQDGAREDGRAGRHAYLKRKLDAMWGHTVPFLQIKGATSRGQGKNFCTFSREIFEDLDEETQLILDSQLTQKGGTDGNGEVSKYMIYFYRVMYNLRATDVQDFVAEDAGDAPNLEGYFDLRRMPDNAGRMFRDYYETINIQNRTRLTPHIDKSWGNILVLPDLNPGYTKRRTAQMLQAFYVMWLDGTIRKEGDGYTCRMNGVRKEEPYAGLWEILDEVSMDIGSAGDELWRFGGILRRQMDEGMDFDGTFAAQRIRDEGLFRLPYEYIAEQQRSRWNAYVLYDMTEAILEMFLEILRQFYPERECIGLLRMQVDDDLRRLRTQENMAACQRCRDVALDVCMAHGWYQVLLDRKTKE